MPELSIVSIVHDSPLWIELCIKSIRRFTQSDHELIIIDNGSSPENLWWLREQSDIWLIENGDNSRSHGGGMDQAIEVAEGRHVCIIDSDAHVQRRGWETDLLTLYASDPLNRLLCKTGPIGIGRPLAPPVFLVERDFIREHHLTFRHQKGDSKSTDTAQKVYWDILELGYKVQFINRGAHIYDPAVDGDEVWVAGKPTIYHHHYGTRIKHTGDNAWKWTGWTLPEADIKRHEARTALLFNQPLVRDILQG